MASHEVVTTLVTALHTNIDSIHATLQSLSSHPTHEAELQRLASEREAKIFDLRTAHAQALQVLANQRLKEQDELEAQRQREAEELEEQRRKEWEEVLKRRAKEDEERQERIREEELERERVKREEDECREAQREERELKLAEDIEKELERVEDEIEAKVEEGKKALRELDEKRKAINAEIDKALNMPTVIPKIAYRSRTRTLSRAGTMEQPRSPPIQAMESANPAANKAIQTPEPGAWLGKDIGLEVVSGNGEDNRIRHMPPAESKFSTSSDKPASPRNVSDAGSPKDNISNLTNEHHSENEGKSHGEFSEADAINHEAASHEISAANIGEKELGKTTPDGSNVEMTSKTKTVEVENRLSPSPANDIQHQFPSAGSPSEITADPRDQRGLPPAAPIDDTMVSAESHNAREQPDTQEKSFEEMYPELQIQNLDALAPEPEPETHATKVNEQEAEQEDDNHDHAQRYPLDDERDESDEFGNTVAKDLEHIPHNSAFADSGIDLINDAQEFSPRDTPESGSAFQSTQMTPIASSDNLIKHELESQRMMLPVNDASDDQIDAQLPNQSFDQEVVHDPMADLLWGRVSPAPEAPKSQQTSVTERSKESTNDPMADLLWGRTSMSTNAPQSAKIAPPSSPSFLKKTIHDPMFDILWERTQTPPSDASKARNDQQAPIAVRSRELADPMSDFLWGRRQIPRSDTTKAINNQTTPVKGVSKKVIHDPMFDILWGRARVSQSDATESLRLQRTPSKDASEEVIYDPMSDILWGRSQVSRAPEALKRQNAHVPDASRDIISDPMSDFLWGRNRESSLIPREAPDHQQMPVAKEPRHDPMADLLWGRNQMSRFVSPDAPKQQQVPVSKNVTIDPMSDILWGRSDVSHFRSPAAPQHQQTPDAIEYIHDPMSDILWGRIPESPPSVSESRGFNTSPSLTNTVLPSKDLEHQQAPVTEPSHDPMSDFLWGRSHTSPGPAVEIQGLNTSPTATNTELQGEPKPYEATASRESQINGFEEGEVEDVTRSHEDLLPDTGSWPLATRRDLIIDHGEDNLSTTSVEEGQSIVGQATSSQLDTDETRHVFSPESPFNRPESHDSIPPSSQDNAFQDTNVEQRQYPPARHHEGEPWPLRDEDRHIPMNNDVAHDQGDHDESEDVSEGSDNWSESDEEEGSESEQRFGSLRPHQIHRMTNEDEYLPRSARNIAATDSEDDMSFEEKYGVPRPTSPIRSLSRVDNHPESPHTGPDASELFEDDDDSEDESSSEHGQRESYPEDLADQYFQRADTPLEVVPEHAPLTQFFDTYAAHRSSGLFANIVDVVRSDVPAVRQVQLDNHQPGTEYELGNATRPRAVSFEDEDTEYAQTPAPHESSLHVRTHTADTVPSFDSYAQSDSIPTTPSETSTSPFMDTPHDEPIIRDSGRERGMTETSQSAQELALETPKAAAFDPALTNAYPSFMSPKPSYTDLRDDHRNLSDIERMNAGYGSFGVQTGLEAHRAEMSPIKDTGRNPFTNGLDTSQTPRMASNNPFKTSPANLNSPGSVSSKTPTAEGPFQATRSLPRTPPRLSISPQSSSSPTGLNGTPSPSPGLSKRPPPPVPTGSPGSLFAKTRSVFESASPQGSPALTPSPITALSAIRHNSPPLPPPPRRSVGSRPSSLYISEPVQYSPPAEKEQEQSNGQEQQEEPDEEAFMPRSLDGNNKPPSPVFIPSRSGSVSSLRKEDEEPLVKKRTSNPFLGGLSRFVGGIQSGGLDDSMHNPAREPLLKRVDDH